MSKETSPLLSNEVPVYQSSGSTEDLTILQTVISTQGDSCTAQTDEQLLKKRLNGASLYAVFSG